MEIKSQALVDVVEDVICDVCRSGTGIPGYGPQYGKLEAQWGYGSRMMGSTTGCISVSPAFQGAEWVASGAHGQWYVR